MTSIADSSVLIQTSSESAPATPSWFGEGALIIPYLHKQGVLSAISAQVRLVRRRFGHDEVIDFLAVLFGYAISGERTLEAFYEQLVPLAQPFMALFDRQRLPSRSALSRFLASLSLRGHRSLAHALSRRFARAPSGHRATHRPTCRSNRHPTRGL